MKTIINKSWQKELKSEFEKPYFKEIEAFIETEKRKGKVVFPKEENVFNIFDLVGFQDVKVVVSNLA